MGWLTGWTRRKSITISHASGVVTNHQMRILIGESSGAAGEDVDCGGHCLSSFNDLRFTASDGETLLPYWIESITGATPNQLATVWVKFDSIGTSDTTFYMYYENAAAAAASSGADTFIDFVDNGATPDTDGWNSGTYRAGDVACRARAMIPDSISDYSGIGLMTSANAYVRAERKDASANYSLWQNFNGTNYNDWSTTALGFDAIHIYELGRIATGTAKSLGWVDGASAGTSTTYVPTGDVRISVSANVQLYWAFMRNYRETGPAWGAWGSEEISPFGSIVGAAGIQAAFAGDSLAGSIAEGTGINAAFDASGSTFSQEIPGGVGLHLDLVRVSEIERALPAAAGIAADFDGFNWTDFLQTCRERITIRYSLTVSDPSYGADIVVPISSFQGRFRSGDPTFLSVVVPGNDQYADISAREDGELILTMQYALDGVVFRSEEICRVDIEEIRLDYGSQSVSVTISGHKTVTNYAKVVQLTGESYKAVYSGKIHYRCTPDLYLRPGDNCLVGGDSFIAGMITWVVTPDSVTMEIAEEGGEGGGLA